MVDEIGKNVSGSGMDTNVIGRGYPIELGVVSEVGAMVDVLHELAAEVEIDKNEVRVDKFCASGPGGQHVN